MEHFRDESDPGVGYGYEIGLVLPAGAANGVGPTSAPPSGPGPAAGVPAPQGEAPSGEAVPAGDAGDPAPSGEAVEPEGEGTAAAPADPPADGSVVLGPETVEALGCGIGEQIQCLARRVGEQLSRPAGSPSRQGFIVDAVELAFGVSVRAGAGRALTVLVDPAGETNVEVTVTLKRAPELIRPPARPVFS